MNSNRELNFVICPNCPAKLFKVGKITGSIEIICPKCGAEVKITGKKVTKVDTEVLSYN